MTSARQKPGVIAGSPRIRRSYKSAAPPGLPAASVGYAQRPDSLQAPAANNVRDRGETAGRCRFGPGDLNPVQIGSPGIGTLCGPHADYLVQPRSRSI